MANEPAIGDDILDSRDMKKYLEELESQWEDKVTEAMKESKKKFLLDDSDFDEDAFRKEFEEKCEDDDDEDLEELKRWRKILEEAENATDFKYGAVFIHEDYFVRYAEEFSDEIGATKFDASWPYNHIDWEAAANELKQDFTIYTFDGVTYYCRS